MRLEFKNADWKRVVVCYLFYACVVFIMAWPRLCLPSGICGTPFDWLWNVYFAGSQNFTRLAAVVGLEFLISLIAGLLVQYKPPGGVADRDFYRKIGVVIPCHKSASVICETLERALRHFPPENICVMDNGRSETPLDNCLEQVRNISPRVIYRWVPIGHKAVALMMGSRLLPDHVEYLLLIDDDVLIPTDMRLDESYFNDKQVSAVAYSIAGCGPDNTVESMNQVQRFQDFEFKLADTYRSFASQYSTVMFAHGAVGLWRRSRFAEIYSSHPGLPIGEDGWAGRLNLLRGYTMKHDCGPVFRTEVPPIMVPTQWWGCWNGCRRKKDAASSTGAVVAGYGSPDLFNQRARRWDMNSPRRIVCHARLFLTYGWGQFRRLPFHRALAFNVIFRLSILRGAWSLFGALVYISYIARVAYSSNPLWVLVLLTGLYALQVIKYLLINYCVWRRRKDLRVSIRTMLLMPLYRKVMVVYRCYGYFRSVIKYVPIVKSPPQVLGKRNDLIDTWPRVRDQKESELVRAKHVALELDGDSCPSEVHVPRNYGIHGVGWASIDDDDIYLDMEEGGSTLTEDDYVGPYADYYGTTDAASTEDEADGTATGHETDCNADDNEMDLTSFVGRMGEYWDKLLKATLSSDTSDVERTESFSGRARQAYIPVNPGQTESFSIGSDDSEKWVENPDSLELGDRYYKCMDGSETGSSIAEAASIEVSSSASRHSELRRGTTNADQETRCLVEGVSSAARIASSIVRDVSKILPGYEEAGTQSIGDEDCNEARIGKPDALAFEKDGLDMAGFATGPSQWGDASSKVSSAASVDSEQHRCPLEITNAEHESRRSFEGLSGEASIALAEETENPGYGHDNIDGSDANSRASDEASMEESSVVTTESELDWRLAIINAEIDVLDSCDDGHPGITSKDVDDDHVSQGSEIFVYAELVASDDDGGEGSNTTVYEATNFTDEETPLEYLNRSDRTIGRTMTENRGTDSSDETAPSSMAVPRDDVFDPYNDVVVFRDDASHAEPFAAENLSQRVGRIHVDPCATTTVEDLSPHLHFLLNRMQELEDRHASAESHGQESDEIGAQDAASIGYDGIGDAAVEIQTYPSSHGGTEIVLSRGRTTPFEEVGSMNERDADSHGATHEEWEVPRLIESEEVTVGSEDEDRNNGSMADDDAARQMPAASAPVDTNDEATDFLSYAKKPFRWAFNFSLTEDLNLSSYVNRMERLFDLTRDYTLAEDDLEANIACTRAGEIATAANNTDG